MMAVAYSDAFCGAIRSHYHPLKHSAKLLARIGQVSRRTAENWLAGESAPSLDNLIPLLAANDKLLDELLAMVEAHKKCVP